MNMVIYFMPIPCCYVSEFIAFSPKMYQIILKDSRTSQVIKWVKMMKGISLRGNVNSFSLDKIPLYRNPVLDFCCVLQYGSQWKYESIPEIWQAMLQLKCNCVHNCDDDDAHCSSLSVVITLDQTIFKRE